MPDRICHVAPSETVDADVKAVRSVIAAEERERQRLSRDLHDHMGQHLVALRFALAALRPHLPQATVGMVEKLERSIAQMDDDLHRVVHDLRPASLDLGLEAALECLIQTWSQRTGLQADAHISHYADPLATQVESSLYRIAQEALNNVARHAEARSISLVLHRTRDRVAMIVEDDGHGFDVGSMDVQSAAHCGLRGMRERVTLLGGTLTIESTPNGSSIFVNVPIRSTDNLTVRASVLGGFSTTTACDIEQ